MRKCCHNLREWFKISISFYSSRLMNLLFLDPLKTLTSHVTLRISGFSHPKSRNCMDYKVTPLSVWCQISPEYIWTRGAQGQPKFPQLHFPERPGDSNKIQGVEQFANQWGLFLGLSRKWEDGSQPGSWLWDPGELGKWRVVLWNRGLILFQMWVQETRYYTHPNVRS